jgi:TetR/AcrR family tetracycline transcriptional repressor
MALGTERIVEAALDLLKEVGLDRLSTRRLATALDVQGPSLYHHFRNKAELLGQMAASMVQTGFVSLDAEADWDVWLRALAHASRAMILEYRDGARLLASSDPSDVMRHELLPRIAQPLVAAGFSRPVANETVAALASFVIGWTINEQNERMRALMESMMTLDEGFAAAVDTFIIGVAVRAGRPLPNRHGG